MCRDGLQKGAVDALQACKLLHQKNQLAPLRLQVGPQSRHQFFDPIARKTKRARDRLVEIAVNDLHGCRTILRIGLDQLNRVLRKSGRIQIVSPAEEQVFRGEDSTAVGSVVSLRPLEDVIDDLGSHSPITEEVLLLHVRILKEIG